MTRAVALALAVLSGLSVVVTTWGHAGRNKPGGVASQRAYDLAATFGPLVAVVTAVVAAALSCAVWGEP